MRETESSSHCISSRGGTLDKREEQSNDSKKQHSKTKSIGGGGGGVASGSVVSWGFSLLSSIFVLRDGTRAPLESRFSLCVTADSLR